jgi:hypothetical protein
LLEGKRSSIFKTIEGKAIDNQGALQLTTAVAALRVSSRIEIESGQGIISQ